MHAAVKPPGRGLCTDQAAAEAITTGDAKRYDRRGVSANKGDNQPAVKGQDKGLCTDQAAAEMLEPFNVEAQIMEMMQAAEWRPSIMAK